MEKPAPETDDTENNDRQKTNGNVRTTHNPNIESTIIH